jgi:hypothetical protein
MSLGEGRRRARVNVAERRPACGWQQASFERRSVPSGTARTLHGLRARISQRLLALAAGVALSHPARPPHPALLGDDGRGRVALLRARAS